MRKEPNELISFFFSLFEKPWPIIERFLQNLTPGSVGLDVGCGNGKYLAVNRDVFIVASDRLVLIDLFFESMFSRFLGGKIVKRMDFRRSVGSEGYAELDRGWLSFHSQAPQDEDKPFDTGEKGNKAPQNQIDQSLTLSPNRSTNLAAIAAQHQPHAVAVADILALPHPLAAFDFAISIAVVHHLSTSERRSEAIASILAHLKPGGKALVYVWALEQEGSRRGWGEGGEQDVMVPWVMKGKVVKKVKGKGRGKGKKQGEDVGEGEQEQEQEQQPQPQEVDRTFHRYYHLYRQGELEENVREAGGVVVESGYEKDNWWAIAERA
jgi:tRNA (uracil-5-)-methyltransferase TRM9